MNAVQNLINQQLGFYKWRTYNSAIERLHSSQLDEIQFDEEDPSSPTFACKFSQIQGAEHLLALSNEDGWTTVYNTKNKDKTKVQAHFNAIFDLAWLFGQMKLVTVSGDHTAKLINVSEGGLQVERMFIGHTRSVKTVAVKMEDSCMFATGGRDAGILLWDTRAAGAASFITTPDKEILMSRNVTPSKKTSNRKGIVSGYNSITGLAFQDDNTLISCSAGDGMIKIWDLRKTYKMKKHKEPLPKCMIPYSGPRKRCGYSNLILDSDRSKLYVSCLDSTIYCYNALTYNPEPKAKYFGHKNNNSFYVKSCLSPDGEYLLSGSCDENAYIWNVNSPEPLVRLRGHSAEVTCVAWCQTTDSIVTCSDDFRHLIWKIGPEVLPDNWEVIGRGRAEVPTPRLNKRQLEHEQSTSKRLKFCNYCNDLDKHCENCCVTQTSKKRLNVLIDHIWSNPKKKTKTADSSRTEESVPHCVESSKILTEVNFVNRLIDCFLPKPDNDLLDRIIYEDVTSTNYPHDCPVTPKRLRTSSDELRPNDESPDLTRSPKRLKLIPEESTAPLDDTQDRLNADETSEARTNGERNAERTEAKDFNLILTPKSTRLTSDVSPVNSPTMNLPNFNVDGSAPHLHFSPQKKADRDWLTKLRIERNLKREMRERVNGPFDHPGSSRLDGSPRGAHDRSVRAHHHLRNVKAESPKSPLLQYFRVTNSSVVKEAQCGLKSTITQQNDDNSSLDL